MEKVEKEMQAVLFTLVAFGKMPDYQQGCYEKQPWQNRRFARPCAEYSARAGEGRRFIPGQNVPE